jgi:hypothetical protein
MSFLVIRIPIANSCTRRSGIFKELSQDEEGVDFSENLRASLFNAGLLSARSISLYLS